MAAPLAAPPRQLGPTSKFGTLSDTEINNEKPKAIDARDETIVQPLEAMPGTGATETIHSMAPAGHFPNAGRYVRVAASQKDNRLKRLASFSQMFPPRNMVDKRRKQAGVRSILVICEVLMSVLSLIAALLAVLVTVTVIVWKAGASGSLRDQ
ncbi:MAG: hypothetical protein AB7K64_02880 [Variibacter sp.]